MTDIDNFRLEVKTSLIDNAGNGVFTTQEIKDKDIICEYRGTVICKKDDPKDSDTSKDINLRNDYIIRGNTIGSMVNDLVDFSPYSVEETILLLITGKLKRTKRDNVALTYNCQYIVDSDRVFIIALRDIKVGEELYCEYGKSYWICRLLNAGHIKINDETYKQYKNNVK